ATGTKTGAGSMEPRGRSTISVMVCSSTTVSGLLHPTKLVAAASTMTGNSTFIFSSSMPATDCCRSAHYPRSDRFLQKYSSSIPLLRRRGFPFLTGDHVIHAVLHSVILIPRYAQQYQHRG